MLNYTKNVNGTEMVIALEGKLDTNTAPGFESYLQENLGGITKLVLDLEKLQYCSSAGLRVLLTAQKTMNAQGSMVLHNTSDDIKEIFDVTGFSDILTLE